VGVPEQGTRENIWTYEEVVVTGEDCIMRSFIICTLHHILLGRSNQGD
jgi:hypothetical protein